MTTKAENAKTDRRSFLKFAGLGSIAGGTALVAGKKAEASEAKSNSSDAGYTETDHVKAFYKSARF